MNVVQRLKRAKRPPHRSTQAKSARVGSIVFPKMRLPKDMRRILASIDEAIESGTMRTLWRGRLAIVSFLVAGIMLSLLVILLEGKRYTAEAILHLDFTQEEIAKVTAPPIAAMDAAILIEGEARLIRSQALLRRVAKRLKLDTNPAYASRGVLSRLTGIFNRSSTATLEPSSIDLAAQSLAAMLTVTNDSRSYLINIGITSSSPAESAWLANGFAAEYLSGRLRQRLSAMRAGARTALVDTLVIYGEKHPNTAQARVNLDAVIERLEELERQNVGTADTDQVALPQRKDFTRAEPIGLPTGRTSAVILGTGAVASLVVGVAFVFLRERRDTGFCSEQSVSADTGVRCVGMIPRACDGKSPDRKLEQQEALRGLCFALGLAQQHTGSRTVLITPACGADKSNFVVGLAAWLRKDGQRVLILDTKPSSHLGAGASLDDVLGNSERLHQFLIDQADQPVSELRRVSALNGTFNPFASFASLDWNLDRLLIHARDRYDVILIETQPAPLFSDCILLGRFADLSLLVANWKETPRATVKSAVRRLRDNAQRVDGIVIAEVDLGQYVSFATKDRTYYLSQYFSNSARQL